MTAQKQKRYQIIIDIRGASNKILWDQVGLTNFLLAFPAKIGMQIMSGPVVTHGFPEDPGLSGFVMVDFSHISVHTFPKYHEALVDIFSCRPYDQEAAKKAVLSYFKTDKKQAKIQEVSWG